MRDPYPQVSVLATRQNHALFGEPGCWCWVGSVDFHLHCRHDEARLTPFLATQLDRLKAELSRLFNSDTKPPTSQPSAPVEHWSATVTAPLTHAHLPDPALTEAEFRRLKQLWFGPVHISPIRVRALSDVSEAPMQIIGDTLDRRAAWLVRNGYASMRSGRSRRYEGYAQ